MNLTLKNTIGFSRAVICYFIFKNFVPTPKKAKKLLTALCSTCHLASALWSAFIAGCFVCSRLVCGERRLRDSVCKASSVCIKIFRAISFPGSSPITRHREREGQWTIEDIRKWSFDFVFFLIPVPHVVFPQISLPKTKNPLCLKTKTRNKQTNKNAVPVTRIPFGPSRYL